MALGLQFTPKLKCTQQHKLLENPSDLSYTDIVREILNLHAQEVYHVKTGRYQGDKTRTQGQAQEGKSSLHH